MTTRMKKRLWQRGLVFLIPRIIDGDNMDRAFDEVVSKVPEPRRSRLRSCREAIISAVTRRIVDGTFRIRGYRQMEVKDGPKDRVVQSPNVEDRIGCNAIMRVVEDCVYPSVIKTSASSIPGRGMHRLFAKIVHDVENDKEGTAFYYKCDIKKFYQSINQDLMWEVILGLIKDPILLPMLKDFVYLMHDGLSIGLRSSQCFGNILLSSVDHELKDRLHVKYFYRFCDDFVVLGHDKEYLWFIRDVIHEKVSELGLEIKANERVCPLSSGLDFLGYVYDGQKARLRKRTKVKAARRLARVKSRKRRQELIGSLKGMAKWGDCRNMFKAITGKDMDFSTIKKQKEQDGVTYMGKDGKRILSGPIEKLQTLTNLHITVLDFEADVPTKNGPRYVVQFKKDDGNICRYLTNDSEQKFWLEELKKSGQIPFDTVIKSVPFGNGKVRYQFT